MLKNLKALLVLTLIFAFSFSNFNVFAATTKIKKNGAYNTRYLIDTKKDKFEIVVKDYDKKNTYLKVSGKYSTNKNSVDAVAQQIDTYSNYMESALAIWKKNPDKTKEQKMYEWLKDQIPSTPKDLPKKTGGWIAYILTLAPSALVAVTSGPPSLESYDAAREGLNVLAQVQNLVISQSGNLFKGCTYKQIKL